MAQPDAGTRVALLLVACRFGGSAAALTTQGALGFLVQPVAQVLAGLEVGHALGSDGDLLAGARIAAGARLALLDREGAEAAQLDAIAARQGLGDLVKDRGADPLDIPLIA